MKIPRFVYVAAAAALAFTPSLFAQHQAKVRSLGTTSVTAAQQRALTSKFVPLGGLHENLRPMPLPKSLHGKARTVSPATPPSAIFPVVSPDAAEHGFSGINTKDSNDANRGGTAGIGEPPDQGLGGSESQIFETVNLSFRIFSPSGTALTENIGLGDFFAVPPTNGGGVNNFVSDPRVLFDPQTKRFFLSVLEYQRSTTTGQFMGSENLLAVSETSNALGNYFLYQIEACPPSTTDPATAILCLADQPLIGVNDDGFYFDNNIYSNLGSFLETRIIALNKTALIHNAAVINGAVYDLPLDGSVEPAIPAPGQSTTQANGVEYFTESMDFGTGGNTLRIFAMTNTESLESGGVPTLLSPSDFPSEFYSSPVPANQKAGAYPLGQHYGDPEEYLNPDDDRMLQLYFAGGKLYTTLETQLASTGSVDRTGGAWFVIQPQVTTTTVAAHVIFQGYIGINNGSVLYPAFAANNSGLGVIGFSFSGTNYFPSGGYANYAHGAVEPKVHRAALGPYAEDGFTGYPQFGGNGVARWGDYSAAFVSPSGHLWFATEYIPNLIQKPRTQYTDWGTLVSRTK